MEFDFFPSKFWFQDGVVSKFCNVILVIMTPICLLWEPTTSPSEETKVAVRERVLEETKIAVRERVTTRGTGETKMSASDICDSSTTNCDGTCSDTVTGYDSFELVSSDMSGVCVNVV